jgi:SAM-dependent methyltransferase
MRAKRRKKVIHMGRRERALRQIEDRIYRLTVGEPSDGRWQRLVSFMTEQGYAAAAVRLRLGLPTRLDTEDRRVLEELIFPYYAGNIAFTKILFVGCAAFTSHYQREYFADKDFWTIEPEPYQARFGSTNHVMATIEDAAKHFQAGYFDVIFFNGVYGWGLDTLAQGEAAFAACHTCLRDGGHVVFGWNDVPQRTPFGLDKIQSRKSFNRLYFPPLQGVQYFTDTRQRHVFDFYQK